jgi:hypothetical protein
MTSEMNYVLQNIVNKLILLQWYRVESAKPLEPKPATLGDGMHQNASLLAPVSSTLFSGYILPPHSRHDASCIFSFQILGT